MNILVPMVISNTFFTEDTKYIKVLFEIKRKTILEYIIDRLVSIPNSEFIFVIHGDDAREHHIDSIIKLLLPDSKIVVAQGDTKGSACSCLLAIDFIDNDEPLLIVGSDQIINTDLSAIADFFLSSNLDGGTVIFEDVHPKWSFVMLDENDLVQYAAEKNPISKNASAGYYYFRTGEIFIEAAMQMIRKREMTKGQYYVCPTFNEMIIQDQKVGVYRISKSDYFSLTSEKEVEEYKRFIEIIAQKPF